jgi:hypothetical protein
MLAGLSATAVLSLLMVMKAMMGLMPQLDILAMLAGAMGSPDTPLIGWIVHLAIGIVVYGAAIGVLDPKLPGTSHVGHEVMLGVIGWLIMMVVLMPMAGAGLFGMNMGVMAPMVTLVLHLIFGAVLGWFYGRSAVSQDVSSPKAHA